MDKRKILKKIKYKPPNLPHPTFKYLLECNICKKKFWLVNSLYQDGKGSTCGSRLCRNKWQSELLKGRKFTKKWKKKISQAKTGPKHHMWKGGKAKTSQGYICVLKPSHPFADSRGRVPEHRLIMEKHLGRVIDPKETIVHHLNGKKDDNRLENLQIMTPTFHRQLHRSLSSI